MTERPSDPQRPASRIRRWAFFALAIAVGLACVRLGIWQLSRLSERRTANAAARARLDLPALELPRALSDVQDLAYRRAIASGVFDAAHEIYLTSRPREGIAGLHVVTPLLLSEDGPALLVDRGWIDDANYRTRPPESWSVQGEARMSGTLLPSQREPSIAFLADRLPEEGEPPLREWRALSIPDIARQLPYPILGVYLMQESPSPGTPAPEPSPELDLSEGSHLGYAIQWFAFAAIAFIGGGLWLRRAPGRRPSENSG